ncbi:MAG: hydrolase Nlp/P60 [Saprospiraceae bacterium]|nr:MAG: hydrolase Nlp/P60 [Saprospiraceae bacterium]
MAICICPLSMAPVRNSASHKSEMLTQVLFGEMVEILEEKGRQWCKVRCCDDNSVGWMATNQLKALTPSEYADYRENFAFVLEFMQPAMAEDHFLPITLGARLPNFDGMRFRLGEVSYNFSGQAVFQKDMVVSNSNLIIKLAKRYLNAPFLWGGRSPLGIDSSGFVQVVFRMAGVKLTREAEQQIFQGENVHFIDHAWPGDLAFFENYKGRVTHVGIIMEDKQIIHAYGKVRIDTIDHYGIYNQDQKRYTHRLRLIKRLLTNQEKPEHKKSEDTEILRQQIELF